MSGENGYQYTNKEDFLTYLDAMLSDPTWRKQAGKRSEELSAAFSKDAFSEAVEDVYESVIH